MQYNVYTVYIDPYHHPPTHPPTHTHNHHTLTQVVSACQALPTNPTVPPSTHAAIHTLLGALQHKGGASAHPTGTLLDLPLHPKQRHRGAAGAHASPAVGGGGSVHVGGGGSAAGGVHGGGSGGGRGRAGGGTIAGGEWQPRVTDYFQSSVCVCMCVCVFF